MNSYLSLRSMSCFPSICSLTFLADMTLRSASLRIAKHKNANVALYVKSYFDNSNIQNLIKGRQIYLCRLYFQSTLYILYIIHEQLSM